MSNQEAIDKFKSLCNEQLLTLEEIKRTMVSIINKCNIKINNVLNEIKMIEEIENESRKN